MLLKLFNNKELYLFIIYSQLYLYLKILFKYIYKCYDEL